MRSTWLAAAMLTTTLHPTQARADLPLELQLEGELPFSKQDLVEQVRLRLPLAQDTDAGKVIRAVVRPGSRGKVVIQVGDLVRKAEVSIEDGLAGARLVSLLLLDLLADQAHTQARAANKLPPVVIGQVARRVHLPDTPPPLPDSPPSRSLPVISPASSNPARQPDRRSRMKSELSLRRQARGSSPSEPGLPRIYIGLSPTVSFLTRDEAVGVEPLIELSVRIYRRWLWGWLQAGYSWTPVAEDGWGDTVWREVPLRAGMGLRLGWFELRGGAVLRPYWVEGRFNDEGLRAGGTVVARVVLTLVRVVQLHAMAGVDLFPESEVYQTYTYPTGDFYIRSGWVVPWVGLGISFGMGG